LPDKERGIGIAVLIAIALWAWSKARAAPPPDEVPVPPPDEVPVPMPPIGIEPMLLSLAVPRVASGGKVLAEATFYLPRSPGGSGWAEAGVLWQGIISDPVYIITIETEEKFDWGWDTIAPLGLISARMTPDDLTKDNDKYRVTGRDGRSVGIFIPQGTYPLKG
jgi:hypothetical protein